MLALIFGSLIHFQLTFTHGVEEGAGTGRRRMRKKGCRGQCGTRAVRDTFHCAGGAGSTGYIC